MKKESESRRLRFSLRRAISALAVVGVVGGCVWAEEVSVNRKRLEVLKGKSSMSGSVATAAKGDKLQVVAHEGHWLKVQCNGVEGYVLEAALNSPDTASASATGGLSSSSDVTAAAAAKGFDPVVWAKGHGYSLDGLNKMQATHDRIMADGAARHIQFKDEGHLN